MEVTVRRDVNTIHSKGQPDRTLSLATRIGLAVFGIAAPIGLAAMGGFMGVFMMAIGSDGANSQDVNDAAWTFHTYAGSMGLVALSGIAFAIASLKSSRRVLLAGFGMVALGILGAVLSFGTYFAMVAG